MQCLKLFQVRSNHPNSKKQHVSVGILSELFENNIRQGPKTACVQVKAALCAFSEGDIDAVAELNSLIPKKILHYLEHHRSMDIALATHEELLLLLEYKVCQAVKGGQRSRPQRFDYLALKYALRWKRHAYKTKSEFTSFEQGSWVAELVLKSCSQSTRLEICFLISLLCGQSSSLRFQLFNLLMSLLPATLAVGENAAEYFEMLFKMIDLDDVRLFLTGFVLHNLIELLGNFLEVHDIISSKTVDAQSCETTMRLLRPCFGCMVAPPYGGSTIPLELCCKTFRRSYHVGCVHCMCRFLSKNSPITVEPNRLFQLEKLGEGDRAVGPPTKIFHF
ncbi:hypothetical protein Vadar_000237 [Vaccinium darrowii]|uniref:Uncharacterized protein n=1 Tax=Vaccinium darrowii TaxID=229202 RepID=A0ACB7XET2_9ERIC|nr:hypothetical protein Vadar_000237 [Vaccinium darrowii]